MVLAVVFLLIGLSLVGLTPAVREGRINHAANVVTGVATDAILYSRALQDYASEEYYGVRLQGDAVPNRVVLVQHQADGSSVVRTTYELNPNAQFFRGDVSLSGSWTCWFQPVSGFPFDPATDQVESFGTGPVSTDEHLSLRSRDQEVSLSIGIYEPAIVNVVSTAVFEGGE